MLTNLFRSVRQQSFTASFLARLWSSLHRYNVIFALRIPHAQDRRTLTLSYGHHNRHHCRWKSSMKILVCFYLRYVFRVSNKCEILFMTTLVRVLYLAGLANLLHKWYTTQQVRDEALFILPGVHIGIISSETSSVYYLPSLVAFILTLFIFYIWIWWWFTLNWISIVETRFHVNFVCWWWPCRRIVYLFLFVLYSFV
jgi:hypothetical protein